jgi:hypothetical protein
LFLALGICLAVALPLLAGWRWLARPSYTRDDFCHLRERAWQAKGPLSRQDVVDVLGRPSQETWSQVMRPMGPEQVSVAQWRAGEVPVWVVFNTSGNVVAMETFDVPPNVAYKEPPWPQRMKDWVKATWRRWVG